MYHLLMRTPVIEHSRDVVGEPAEPLWGMNCRYKGTVSYLSKKGLMTLSSNPRDRACGQTCVPAVQSSQVSKFENGY